MDLIVTGEKNRAPNRITISSLKLDDVAEKSSIYITVYILEHLGEIFDITPFVHRRCKHLIEEFSVTVESAVSQRLHQSLDHKNELEKHKKNRTKSLSHF